MRYPSNFAFSSSSGNPNDFLASREPHHHQGNRSRLDSGTSGTSGSSGSSESSKGSGKPPRRRSHRPRGCRGGSNRRRNNSDGANKLTSKGSDTGSETNTGSKTILSKHPSYKQVITGENGALMQDYTILSRQPQQPNPALYIDCQQGLPQRDVSTSSSVSTSTAPMTDYSSSQESFENQMFPNEFSEIQPSFSDSSSEFGTDPISQDFLIPASDSYGYGGDIMNNNQILPPLPSNAFHNEYIPSVPNPYALKPSIYDNTNNMMYARENFPQFHEPSYNMTATKFAGGYATPMKNLAPPHLHHNSYPLQCHYYNIENGMNMMNMKDGNPNPTMGPPAARPKLLSGIANQASYSTNITNSSNIPVTCSSDSDYRAERLEIQRQNVEGGSLFVTSPRSFLMGKRNAF
jgi:hypothetical protein